MHRDGTYRWIELVPVNRFDDPDFGCMIAGFKDMEEIIEQRTPLRQNIQAADAGQAALYLCSPMSQMVTGTTVYVDSGYHSMGI